MTMINSSGQIILTVMILYIYIYIYCDGYHHCDRTFFYRLPSTTRECEISTFFFFFFFFTFFSTRKVSTFHLID